MDHLPGPADLPTDVGLGDQVALIDAQDVRTDPGSPDVLNGADNGILQRPRIPRDREI
jgi:hypothetical protein